jgi:hypothetical protein
MAKNWVNLDALIPREDLSVGEGVVTGKQGDLKISMTHLRDKFFAGTLRKPEFQRETIQWSPAKIVDLVSAILDDQLVPAVILWHAAPHNFVVDGAHRLSAMLAWIYDDYGDGERSIKLFGPNIPPEQLALANKTRTLAEKMIGSYTRFAAGLDHPKIATPLQKIRIPNMSMAHFVAQWVPAVTARAAEDSFFKINDAATPLDATEKRILQSRSSANAIAARAISHGGKGFSYWRDFDNEDTRESIETLSGRIFSLLYKPPLADGPIDTLDVPVAGRGYSVLPFVFDLVNAINDPKVADSTGKGSKDKLPADPDGTLTVNYLKSLLKSVQRITGKEATSLGLHPVAYFFTKGGAFSPWAFLAWSKIVDDLFARNRVNAFCDARQHLEEFLLDHKWAMTEIIHKNGSGHRSTPWLERYWRFVVDEFISGKTYAEVVAAVPEQPGFAMLATKSPVIRMAGENSDKSISASTRTAAIWDNALPGAPRCPHCNSRYHRNSIHGDHLLAKRDGGDGRPENAGITHPYCDSTYKDWKAARALRQTTSAA